MMPMIKLEIAGAIIWAWALIICSACAQERGTVIHKRPVEGMEGYKVIIREAREPEKRVYQAEDIRIQELDTYKAQPPSAEPQEEAVELPSSTEEAVPQPLRRQKIPLRRNRNLLLKQQSDFPNILSD